MKKLNLFRNKKTDSQPEAVKANAPAQNALDQLLADFAEAESAALPLETIRRRINAAIGAELVMQAKAAPRGTTAAEATVANITDAGFQMTEITAEKAAREAEERSAQLAAEAEAEALREKALAEAKTRAAVAEALGAPVPDITSLAKDVAASLAQETALLQAQAAAHDTDAAMNSVKAAKAAAKAARENAKLAQQNAKKAAREARAKARAEQKENALEIAAGKRLAKKPAAKWTAQLKGKQNEAAPKGNQDELRVRRLEKQKETASSKTFVQKALPYASAAAGIVILCVAGFVFRDTLFPKAQMAAPAPAAASAAENAAADIAMAAAPAEPAAPAAPEPEGALFSAGTLAEDAPVSASGASADSEKRRTYHGEAMPDSGLLVSGAEMEGSLEIMLLAADTDYVCYGSLASRHELISAYGDTILLTYSPETAALGEECLFFLKLSMPNADTYAIQKAFPVSSEDPLAQEALRLFPPEQSEPEQPQPESSEQSGQNEQP